MYRWSVCTGIPMDKPTGYLLLPGLVSCPNLVTALTKCTEARPTRGTFGPFPLRCIGFRSHPLSRSELLIRFSEMSLTTSLPILTHNSRRNPYLDNWPLYTCKADSMTKQTMWLWCHCRNILPAWRIMWVKNESWHAASVSTIAQPWRNDDATQEKES